MASRGKAQRFVKLICKMNSFSSMEVMRYTVTRKIGKRSDMNFSLVLWLASNSSKNVSAQVLYIVVWLVSISRQKVSRGKGKAVIHLSQHYTSGKKKNNSSHLHLTGKTVSDQQQSTGRSVLLAELENWPRVTDKNVITKLRFGSLPLLQKGGDRSLQMPKKSYYLALRKG